MFTKLLKNITEMRKTKMVLIVRTDLKMTQGKIASQCAHAAVTLYDSALKTNKENNIKQWIRGGQPKVVLKVSVDSEKRLRDLFEDAKKHNLNACLIYDAGKTEIAHGTLTVLGIGPDSVENVDKITNNLKLL